MPLAFKIASFILHPLRIIVKLNTITNPSVTELEPFKLFVSLFVIEYSITMGIAILHISLPSSSILVQIHTVLFISNHFCQNTVNEHSHFMTAYIRFDYLILIERTFHLTNSFTLFSHSIFISTVAVHLHH